MPRRKQGKDVAPTIRGAFIRAVKGLEDDGRPLSDMVRESLESDFTGTLRAISSFVPKEHLVGGDDENPIKSVSEIRITLVEAAEEEKSS